MCRRWAGFIDLTCGAEDKRWEPKMDAEDRKTQMGFWNKAVTRTFDWAEVH
jgi:glycerol kinase